MGRHFSNHRHVIVPAAAHNTSFSGCVPDLIAVVHRRAAMLADLDASCVDQLRGRRLSSVPQVPAHDCPRVTSRKRYGSTAAVSGVSLDVPDGLVTGLLGPNGAGKTTTIRSMTGLVTLDGGQIEVDGIDVARRPLAARARLGVVPETVGVYDHLTVREHVEYSAALQGVDNAAIATRTNAEYSRNWTSKDSPIAAPEDCPWASAVVWRWRGHWCINRRISSSTNPPMVSM